jgi:Ca2+-binding EF-hand superfamily protein
MLSDLKRRKSTARFNLLDVNQNGHIGQDDYDLLVERITQAFHIPHESETYNTIKAGYIQMWQTLQSVADVDQDGNVTLEEFLASEEKTLSRPDVYEAVVAPQAQRLFNMIDQNKDGIITAGEYKHLSHAYGLSLEDATNSYNHIDRDRDGSVTLDEVMQAVGEFYLSDDPDAHGNWFCGPF